MSSTEEKSERRAPPAGLLVFAALLAGALAWAFWPTFASMERRWSNDARYSHGYLVPLFALFLLWLRRDELTGPQRGNWWGIPVLLLGASLYLAGGYFYFEMFDGAALLPCLAGCALLLGGWPALRWAWPSIGFLVFMLPLPFRVETSLAFPLQRLATEASTYALQTLGFPAVAEGNIILLDQAHIGVVEACNGLGMLVTFFAISTAVAILIKRPLLDRIVVVASAIPVALIVNIIRITVTGVLHETVSSHVANIVFHDLAGWLMMPMALGILALELKYLSRLLVTPKADAGPEVGSIWGRGPRVAKSFLIPRKTTAISRRCRRATPLSEFARLLS